MNTEGDYLLAVSVVCREDSRAADIIVMAPSQQPSQTEISTELWGARSKWAQWLHSFLPQRVQVEVFHSVSDESQRAHFSCV
ncbi:MAG TPA: hypothetical protein VKV40_00585 [Ktedonobacteraceae bacterium]|nr:hypothetical protein [Ktedonobacteraceae bacterium]